MLKERRIKKVLSIEVSEDLHQKVKVHAVKNKITINSLVVSLLTKEVSKKKGDL